MSATNQGRIRQTAKNAENTIFQGSAMFDDDEITPEEAEAYDRYVKCLTKMRPRNLGHLIWIRDEYKKRAQERKKRLDKVVDLGACRVVVNRLARQWWKIEWRVRRLDRRISFEYLMREIFGRNQ